MANWLSDKAIYGNRARFIDDVSSGKRQDICVCPKHLIDPHPLGHCKFCGLRLDIKNANLKTNSQLRGFEI